MSFNKAHKAAQRLHRERRQPEHRKKFGYLEKKKDYKKRADDHNKKAKKLKELKQKALDRNQNEFHFHMINSKIIDGKHIEKKKKKSKQEKLREVTKEKAVIRYNESILNKRRQKYPQEL